LALEAEPYSTGISSKAASSRNPPRARHQREISKTTRPETIVPAVTRSRTVSFVDDDEARDEREDARQRYTLPELMASVRLRVAARHQEEAMVLCLNRSEMAIKAEYVVEPGEVASPGDPVQKHVHFKCVPGIHGPTELRLSQAGGLIPGRVDVYPHDD